MLRQEIPPTTGIISHITLVRLLVVLTVVTVFMNLLLLPPLEEFNTHPLLLNRDKHPSIRSQNTTSAHTAAKPRIDKSRPLEVSFPLLSEEEGRQHILDLFKEAGVDLNPETTSQLPTWTQVQEVIGPHPYLLGLERCEEFRNTVPALERMLGAAGMFNTGTNLVTHLLKQNCEIPERREHNGPHQSKESYGMRWQVPWGK